MSGSTLLVSGKVGVILQGVLARVAQSSTVEHVWARVTCVQTRPWPPALSPPERGFHFCICPSLGVPVSEGVTCDPSFHPVESPAGPLPITAAHCEGPCCLLSGGWLRPESPQDLLVTDSPQPRLVVPPAAASLWAQTPCADFAFKPLLQTLSLQQTGPQGLTYSLVHERWLEDVF